jgi:hypothetical protein
MLHENDTAINMNTTPRKTEPKTAPPGCWTVGAIWVLTSLTAIALIGDTPYLGLAVGILGGIALGLASFLYDRGRESEGVKREDV